MSLSGTISELRRLGITLTLDGSELRFRAPKGAMTLELKAKLTAQKAALIEELGCKNSAESTNDYSEVIKWYRGAVADLPRGPLELRPGERVVDSNLFYAALFRDIEAGPNGPRSRNGALIADLHRLKVFWELPRPEP